MKKVLAGIALGCFCVAGPAQAIENHVQSTPTDLFFFGAGFTPPPSKFGTFALRQTYSNAASIDSEGNKPDVQSKVSVAVTTPSWVYMTNYRLLGARYGFVVVQPFFTMNGGLKGSIPINPHFSIPVDQSSHITGFGNTQIYPILLEWLDLPHLAVNASLGIQFPDGRYDNNPAKFTLNPSTNYWTVFPNAAATYITSYGQEVSTYQEIDVNSANTSTHYKSGAEYKMTASVGQHLGNFTVGPAGYYYQQLQGDSGSGTLQPGATPKAARVLGAGLAFCYVPRLGPIAVFGSFIKEFDARNHAQGIAASIRVSASF